MPGRKQPAVSFPVPDWRQDQVSLCCFFRCIWTAITLKLTSVFFCRPKREKMLKVSGFDILAVLRPHTRFLRFFFFWPQDSSCHLPMKGGRNPNVFCLHPNLVLPAIYSRSSMMVCCHSDVAQIPLVSLLHC